MIFNGVMLSSTFLDYDLRLLYQNRKDNPEMTYLISIALYHLCSVQSTGGLVYLSISSLSALKIFCSNML